MSKNWQGEMAEKLSYEIVGNGEPLVCLHAYGLDHTEWMQVTGILKEDFTLILPDIRGHGGSPSPPGQYSMPDLAGDVIVMLDQLKINQVFYAGHSMGGYIMLALAKRFPERVAGLALVASHAYTDSPEKIQSRLDAIEKVKEFGPLEVLSGMPDLLSDDPNIREFCREKIKRMDSFGVMGVLAAMAHREDSMVFLKSFNKPIGIIAGKHDRFIPLETSREMNALLKPKMYVELDNCGHMPMMENPEAVAQALRELFQI